MGESKVKRRNNTKGTSKDPVIKDGIEYVYNSSGKLVKLERFDPETMERFTLTPDAILTKEQIDRMNEFSVKPVEVDDEYPELTDDQVAAILQKAIKQRKSISK